MAAKKGLFKSFISKIDPRPKSKVDNNKSSLIQFQKVTKLIKFSKPKFVNAISARYFKKTKVKFVHDMELIDKLREEAKS